MHLPSADKGGLPTDDDVTTGLLPDDGSRDLERKMRAFAIQEEMQFQKPKNKANKLKHKTNGRPSPINILARSKMFRLRKSLDARSQ